MLNAVAHSATVRSKKPIVGLGKCKKLDSRIRGNDVEATALLLKYPTDELVLFNFPLPPIYELWLLGDEYDASQRLTPGIPSLEIYLSQRMQVCSHGEGVAVESQ